MNGPNGREQQATALRDTSTKEKREKRKNLTVINLASFLWTPFCGTLAYG